MHQKVYYHLKILKEQLTQNCEQCKGKGCIVCSAQFDLYQQYAKAGIPILYWTLDLKDLDPNGIGIKEVTNYSSRLKMAYDDGKGIFIYGKNGNGKTLSACAIGKQAIKQGYNVKYAFLGEMISAFIDTMYNNDQREKLKEDILKVDFLILDDIDKAYISEKSEFVSTILDTLFRTRVQHKLPVIMTANKSIEEILGKNQEVYSKSLISLFKESLLPIMFHGGDKREELSRQSREKFFK